MGDIIKKFKKIEKHFASDSWKDFYSDQDGILDICNNLNADDTARAVAEARFEYFKLSGKNLAKQTKEEIDQEVLLLPEVEKLVKCKKYEV